MPLAGRDGRVLYQPSPFLGSLLFPLGKRDGSLAHLIPLPGRNLILIKMPTSISGESTNGLIAGHHWHRKLTLLRSFLLPLPFFFTAARGDENVEKTCPTLMGCLSWLAMSGMIRVYFSRYTVFNLRAVSHVWQQSFFCSCQLQIYLNSTTNHGKRRMR